MRKGIVAAIAAAGLMVLCSFTSYASTVFQTVSTPSEGCSLVALEGSYNGDAQAALDRINQIRLEACQEGVRDPRDESRSLTTGDYVPIKWSSSLEYIARVRAAEASIYIAHTRPNGNTWFTAKAPDGKQSYGENLAWDWSNTMVSGVESWYEEKADWVNQIPGKVTGHYTSMIDPDYDYVGLASFTNPNAPYRNTVSGEFDRYFEHSTTMSGVLPDVRVIIEVQNSGISGTSMKVLSEKHRKNGTLDEEDTIQYALMHNTYFDGARSLVFDAGNISWNSSDTGVASVDASGNVMISGVGEATITASSDSGKSATAVLRPAHTPESIAAVPATCTNTGLTEGKKCSVCGKILTAQQTVPALGHKWDGGTVATKPTCTETGIKNIHCTVCNEVKEGTEEIIPALGHAFSEWKVVKKATYDIEGLEQRVCAHDASHIETRAIAKLVKPAETEINETSAPSASAQQKAILAQKNDNDLKGSTFGSLQAKAAKVTKSSITLQWKKVKGATEYVVYGSKCGKGNRYKKLKTVKTTSYTQKKLKKGTYYKYLVVAIKGSKAIATSKTIHAATTGGKVGNNKSVKVNKKSFRIGVGRKATLKATAVAASQKLKVNKHRAIAFESSNKKIATVSSKGVIKGVRKGTCYVYAYAQNGVMAKVKVVVN